MEKLYCVTSPLHLFLHDVIVVSAESGDTNSEGSIFPVWKGKYGDDCDDSVIP